MKIKLSDSIYWMFQIFMLFFAFYFLSIEGFGLFDIVILEIFLFVFLLVKLFELENNIAVRKVKVANYRKLLEYRRRLER